MSMNYDRDSIRAKTSHTQKEIGTVEMVYGTLTKIEVVSEKGERYKKITWKHWTSGNERDHKVTKDKFSYENCYDQLEVGKQYAIRMTLVSHAKGGRWVWDECVELDNWEMDMFVKKVGFVNIDQEELECVAELVRDRRRKAHKEAGKKQLLEDLVRY